MGEPYFLSVLYKSSSIVLDKVRKRQDTAPTRLEVFCDKNLSS